MVIGIIVAIPPEYKVIKNHFKINNNIDSIYKELKITIKEHSLIIYQSGIGKVSSAGAAQHLIDNHSPDYIINLGIIASLSNNLGILDVAISNKFVHWDFNSGFMNQPENWHPEYNSSLLISEIPPGFPESNLITATGDSFISNSKVKESLSTRGYHLCDMEGGAIAQICGKNRIPFILIKGVSDLGEGTGKNFKETIKNAVENSIREFEKFLFI